MVNVFCELKKKEKLITNHRKNVKLLLQCYNHRLRYKFSSMTSAFRQGKYSDVFQDLQSSDYRNHFVRVLNSEINNF